MQSIPAWTRQTLDKFTDAATQAVAKTIVDFQREAARERELQKAQFATRMAELGYRIESITGLERRLAERLSTLKDGRDGVDAVSLTLDDVRPAIADYVDHVLRGWQHPKDGQSLTVQDIEPVLRGLVSDAVAKIAVPKITLDDLRPIIAEQVAEAVARLRQEHQASAHRPQRSGWPRNLPVVDVEATPYPLTEEHVTAAVRLLPRYGEQSTR